MSAIQCPACGVAAAEDSAFCEDCGSALKVAPLATADPGMRCPDCGAGPSAIDSDGFCTQCGHRRLAAPRDHFEDVLSTRAAGVCDIGCRYDENQDYFVMAAGPRDELVAIVCDGVSRSQNSMVGSKISCDTALAVIRDELATGNRVIDDPNAVLTRAISAAQVAICKVPFAANVLDDGELVPPAQATVVGVVVVGRRVTLGWLGDSRAYWVGAKVRQLTIDHSWLEDVVSSGRMTLEEARDDPRARAIVRSLGADMDGRDSGVVPDALTLNVTEPGVLLVVSDGFYTYADDREIATLVRSLGADVDALTMARHLVQHARTAGGSDNITVVAIAF